MTTADPIETLGFRATGLCGATGQPLCAHIDGFGLHAAERVEANDRKRLEPLCRHITRPVLSDERTQLDAAGQVALKLIRFHRTLGYRLVPRGGES